jgi:RecB family endonuclease NucS
MQTIKTGDIQKYARSVEWRGPVAFCFGRPIAVIADGQYWTVDPFYADVLAAWRAAQPAIESESEADFRDRVARSLKASGWTVSKEQSTSQGRIDILAQRNGETRIVETKLSALSNAAAHALGQLLFYVKFYPGATLWFSSPRRPDETILSILGSYGVTFYDVENPQ